MERETFIENCKNLRKGQRGFIVNTNQRTPDSLMYIYIEHEEAIEHYGLIVYNKDVSVIHSRGFCLQEADYKTAWDVLEDRLNRLCNPSEV